MKQNNKNLHSLFPLTHYQIQSFLTNGVLVVDNVLSESELLEARQGLNSTLEKYHVDPGDLERTGHNLEKLSTTNGSGGVLDIFHPVWKLKIAENPILFSIISQLWQATFSNENDDTTSTNDDFPLPFGSFQYNRGFIYLDRIGYRIPTKLSDEIGCSNNKVAPSKEGIKKKKQPKSLQRSLTPHLDCCPNTILANDYSKVSKWRPFQSFVALTDTIQPNTGGFEAVPGFHLQFPSWARNRKNTIIQGKDNCIKQKPAPCLGEFTPIRPKEDIDVIQKMQHIACKAGSFVIWDVRIPHANALYNTSDISRAVVYASFLPDISINRQYVLRQLKLYKEKRKMTDQWVKNRNDVMEDEEDYAFSRLGKFMMGLDDWDRLSYDELDRLYPP